MGFINHIMEGGRKGGVKLGCKMHGRNSIFYFTALLSVIWGSEFSRSSGERKRLCRINVLILIVIRKFYKVQKSQPLR